MGQHSDHFEQNSSIFLEWFTKANGTQLNPNLVLTDFRDSGAGRGVIASADIREDEELFTIPRSLVLDVTNSDLQKHIGIPLAEFGSWNSLILVIVYEYLRKDGSPWYPYLKVLPVTFDTLMFWNQAELAELQGCAVLDKIGKATAEEDFRKTIIPFMKMYPALFPVDGDDADSTFIQLAHMAGSLIMAYAFDLGKSDDVEEEADEDEDGFMEDDEEEEEEEDPAKGMVPLADMLNADAVRNNARLFHEDEFLVMKSTRPIRAGDEIFNDYGHLPRSDLLRMYGYITDNYAQYDVVEISSQIVNEVLEETRQKHQQPRTPVRKLEELSDVEEAYVITRPPSGVQLGDAITTELRMLLSALTADVHPATSARNVSDWAKRSLTSSSADLLAATIRRRLADYKTTIRDDDDLLRRLSSDSGTQRPPGVDVNRYRMAVCVRKGEKEVLEQILQLSEHFITSRTNGKRRHATDEQPPKKAPKVKR